MPHMFQTKTVFTLLASGARTDHTATGSALRKTNTTYRGLRLTIDISAFSGTSITFTVQGVDPISGNAYTILASAAKSATGTFYLHIYPGAAATANVSIGEVLPYQWQLTSSGTITSVTWSAHAEYLP